MKTEMKTVVETIADRAVGQTESEARRRVKSLGLVFRVTKRNGKPQKGDGSVRQDRVSVRVDNGIVVEAKVG